MSTAAAVFQLLAVLTGTAGIILACVSANYFRLSRNASHTSDTFIGGCMSGAASASCFILCVITTMMTIGASH